MSAPTDTRARQVTAWLGQAGLAATVSSTLEEGLRDEPQVVVVDPSGWEDSCRRVLEAYDDRPGPPPAVLFTGPDPLVIHTAGPAFAFLPEGAHPRLLAGTVARARDQYAVFAQAWPRAEAPLSRRDRARMCRALAEKSGLEIRSDRQAALTAAVRVRIVATLSPTPRAYADLLWSSKGATELDALSTRLSVGETYCWRYEGQFRALQDDLMPDWVGRTARVWSAGCASGEEVYSLAISCLESLGPGARVEIVGTDIHEPSLARARIGQYGDRSVRNLPPEYRERYGEMVNGRWRVSARLRSLVRFERLNLGGPEVERWAQEHGPFDAIFCRNTLIYFGRETIDRLLDVFEDVLVPGGGLFLGPAESIFPRRPALKTVRVLGCYYSRRMAAETEPRLVSSPKPGSAAEPHDPFASLFADGLGLLDGEDFEGAERVFGTLEQRAPHDPRGYTGLALVRASQGREGEAAEYLARGGTAVQTLPEYHFVRALLAERRGDETEALAEYRSTLGADPGFVMARVNRAWIQRRLGRETGFRTEMRAALKDLTAGRGRVSLWMTGGLGWEGLLELVSTSLEPRVEGGP